jgi:hypothetical protein
MYLKMLSSHGIDYIRKHMLEFVALRPRTNKATMIMYDQLEMDEI